MQLGMTEPIFHARTTGLRNDRFPAWEGEVLRHHPHTKGHTDMGFYWNSKKVKPGP